MKKKVDPTATVTIAAAETISVVAFDLVVSFGWGNGDTILTAGAEGSVTGIVALCGGSCGDGGTFGALTGGSTLFGTLRGRTTVGRTSLGVTLLG